MNQRRFPVSRRPTSSSSRDEYHMPITLQSQEQAMKSHVDHRSLYTQTDHSDDRLGDREH